MIAADPMGKTEGSPGVSTTKHASRVWQADALFYTTVQSTVPVIKHYSMLQVIWGKG